MCAAPASQHSNSLEGALHPSGGRLNGSDRRADWSGVRSPRRGDIAAPSANHMPIRRHYVTQPASSSRDGDHLRSMALILSNIPTELARLSPGHRHATDAGNPPGRRLSLWRPHPEKPHRGAGQSLRSEPTNPSFLHRRLRVRASISHIGAGPGRPRFLVSDLLVVLLIRRRRRRRPRRRARQPPPTRGSLAGLPRRGVPPPPPPTYPPCPQTPHHPSTTSCVRPPTADPSQSSEADAVRPVTLGRTRVPARAQCAESNALGGAHRRRRHEAVHHSSRPSP